MGHVPWALDEVSQDLLFYMLSPLLLLKRFIKVGVLVETGVIEEEVGLIAPYYAQES